MHNYFVVSFRTEWHGFINYWNILINLLSDNMTAVASITYRQLLRISCCHPGPPPPVGRASHRTADPRSGSSLQTHISFHLLFIYNHNGQRTLLTNTTCFKRNMFFALCI